MTARHSPSPFGSDLVAAGSRKSHTPSFSIPLISATHAHDEDEDDRPLAHTVVKSKAAEAREAAETVQTVLQENIAGIGECE